ncbi:MAG: DUF2076 domain-containing protein [Xanthobacteraceae bacterium]|nr:DUF2076 domain-containing protein [Xanthobacteraceae bacterium]
MNPQERQMVDDLFDRLAKLEASPRDPEAEAAIMAGLRRAPNAVYAMVQTVLVQDEALRRANDHIEELEGRAPVQGQSGSFLDSMRGAFGLEPNQSRGQSHGSVPNVRPGERAGRPVWNSGQVLGNGQPAGASMPNGGYADPRVNAGYADPRGGMFGGGQPAGGSSFLGTAAAAAAGMIGGSLLMNSIRGLGGGFGNGLGGGLGGNQQSLNGTSGSDKASPWSTNSGSDDSNSNLARDAGVNDVGKNAGADNGQRQDSFDQAQADADQDQDQDQDDDDFDSGDFDGGSDDSGFA